MRNVSFIALAVFAIGCSESEDPVSQTESSNTEESANPRSLADSTTTSNGADFTGSVTTTPDLTNTTETTVDASRAGEVQSTGYSAFTVMHPSADELAEWERVHQSLPETEAGGGLKAMGLGAATTSVNLLSLVSYPLAQRSQGSCGNCWVWASSAVAEVNLATKHQPIQQGISIQYFDSNFMLNPDINPPYQYASYQDSPFACCGGTLSTYADWYKGAGSFVPMTNSNAAYADYNTSCRNEKGILQSPALSFSSIARTPNHKIKDIAPQRVETAGVDTEQAILNVKQVLNENRAITFGFCLPNGAAWAEFGSAWSNEATSKLVDLDKHIGTEWIEDSDNNDNGGCHMVAIVGYDDRDSDKDKHYWIALNSWGVTALRSEGLFRVKQRLNYSGRYYSATRGAVAPAYFFETLQVSLSDK